MVVIFPKLTWKIFFHCLIAPFLCKCHPVQSFFLNKQFVFSLSCSDFLFVFLQCEVNVARHKFILFYPVWNLLKFRSWGLKILINFSAKLSTHISLQIRGIEQMGMVTLPIFLLFPSENLISVGLSHFSTTFLLYYFCVCLSYILYELSSALSYSSLFLILTKLNLLLNISIKFLISIIIFFHFRIFIWLLIKLLVILKVHNRFSFRYFQYPLFL